MATNDNFRYEPDYGVPPGDTLIEILETCGMTQADLAARTGRPLKTINEIAKGKAAITPETSLQFEKVLGVPASFWNNLESNFQHFRAKQREGERLKGYVNWLKELPIKELIKRGCLRASSDPTDLVSQTLGFFGVTDPTVWRHLWLNPKAAFHRSRAFTTSPGAMAAWLRIGELEGQKITCEPFDKTRLRSELDSLKKLTSYSLGKLKRELVEHCRKLGIAVVFVAELPGTHVCGAARWLTPDKALIQLSCRYKSDDQFWHAFFHEVGHIVLHGKRGIFIDDSDQSGTEQQERQAHEFASSVLVPPGKMRQFLKVWQLDQAALEQFAQSLGIAPGIVVGQLQHIKVIAFHQHTRLKRFQFDLTAQN
jgi:HTH-type transcriptional regulator/antitoxin HigA